MSKVSMMEYYFLYIFFFPRSVSFFLLEYKEVIFILDIPDIMDRKTPPGHPVVSGDYFPLMDSNRCVIVLTLTMWIMAFR